VPNQLAPSKRRQSLAEHAAVLAALAQIAEHEDTTVMALLREAAREAVRKRAQSPALAAALRSTVWRLAPRMPEQFTSAAQLARFKRTQREFDRVVMEMQLAAPEEIQARNSIAASRPVRLLNFDQAHAASR
jgi:predicted DNA-binding ribbon-helix-helix protein